MKIGITGTSCSGKTTLVKQLAKYFNFTVIPEVARDYSKESLCNEYIQYDIIFKQIYNELCGEKNIITDRTVIDNYIHLERLFKPKQYTLHLVRSWVQTYDIILLCKKLPFIDDGFRTDINMEKDIISLMKNNYIQYEIIDGNEGDRFDTACEIIKGLIK